MQAEWSMPYSFLLDRGCPSGVRVHANNLNVQP